MKQWHLLEQLTIKWLLDGLLPADGFSAMVGKPKAGKSKFIRSLVAAIVLELPFLNRKIHTDGPGRVLYIHLDRKDRPARVVQELRQLGIDNEDACSRLSLQFAEDVPWTSLGERLAWLQREVTEFQPHLLVIDLLPQFLCSENVNDYAQQLAGVNALQDALAGVEYKGALLAALHGRKASNPDQPFDDVLGSTALRGSFTTLVMLQQQRREKLYTIMSDQTERESPWGEIDEVILEYGSDGFPSLGKSRYEIEKEQKVTKREGDVLRLWSFLNQNPGAETEVITAGLGMSKPRFLELVAESQGQIYHTGRGIKGDPKTYYLKTAIERGGTNEQSATGVN